MYSSATYILQNITYISRRTIKNGHITDEYEDDNTNACKLNDFI